MKACAVFALSFLCQLALPALAQENLSRGKTEYNSALVTLLQNPNSSWVKNDAATKFQFALPYLQSAAKEGYGEACYLLGNMYRYGWGTNRDYEIAKRMYERGIEFGYTAHGEAELGWMYQVGQGVAADSSKAIEYYRKSAERGSILGLYRLAVCSLTGIGTDQDDSTAIELFTRVELSNKNIFDPDNNIYILNSTLYYLGNLYYYGHSPKVIPGEGVVFQQDQEKGVSCLIRSESPGGLYDAAIAIHDNDLKIPLDKNGNYYKRTHYFNAVDLLRKAIAGNKSDKLSNNNMAKAYYLLVIYTMEGPSYSYNTTNLFTYLTKSAELGYGPAQKMLGDWYTKGIGTSINLLKAREWYAKAKANGEKVPE